jgi:hypothetical protein
MSSLNSPGGEWLSGAAQVMASTKSVGHHRLHHHKLWIMASCPPTAVGSLAGSEAIQIATLTRLRYGRLPLVAHGSEWLYGLRRLKRIGPKLGGFTTLPT